MGGGKVNSIRIVSSVAEHSGKMFCVSLVYSIWILAADCYLAFMSKWLLHRVFLQLVLFKNIAPFYCKGLSIFCYGWMANGWNNSFVTTTYKTIRRINEIIAQLLEPAIFHNAVSTFSLFSSLGACSKPVKREKSHRKEAKPRQQMQKILQATKRN